MNNKQKSCIRRCNRHFKENTFQNIEEDVEEDIEDVLYSSLNNTDINNPYIMIQNNTGKKVKIWFDNNNKTIFDSIKVFPDSTKPQKCSDSGGLMLPCINTDENSVILDNSQQIKLDFLDVESMGFHVTRSNVINNPEKANRLEWTKQNNGSIGKTLWINQSILDSFNSKLIYTINQTDNNTGQVTQILSGSTGSNDFKLNQEYAYKIGGLLDIEGYYDNAGGTVVEIPGPEQRRNPRIISPRHWMKWDINIRNDFGTRDSLPKDMPDWYKHIFEGAPKVVGDYTIDELLGMTGDMINKNPCPSMRAWYNNYINLPPGESGTTAPNPFGKIENDTIPRTWFKKLQLEDAVNSYSWPNAEKIPVNIDDSMFMNPESFNSNNSWCPDNLIVKRWWTPLLIRGNPPDNGCLDQALAPGCTFCGQCGNPPGSGCLNGLNEYTNSSDIQENFNRNNELLTKGGTKFCQGPNEAKITTNNINGAFVIDTNNNHIPVTTEARFKINENLLIKKLVRKSDTMTLHLDISITDLL